MAQAGFSRTETQTMLADMLARLLETENAFDVRHRRLSQPQPDRMHLWPLLAKQGLLAAVLPESSGGLGGGARELAVIMALVGRSLAVEPVLASAVAGRLLADGGEADRVAAVAEGRALYVLAHTEGHDAFASRTTTAVADKDVYRLTGAKAVVRHADLADGWLVTASLDGEQTVFLIDKGTEGVSLEPLRLMDGSSGARLSCNQAPARRLAGADSLSQALELTAIGLAAETAGIAMAANDATFSYLKTRQQFGQPLAAFQALQHRAADMFAAAEEILAVTDEAILAFDDENSAVLGLASAAKAIADDNGRRIGHEAVQLHGGMGVSDELDVSHFLRRLAVIRADMGGADVHLKRFADLGWIRPEATGFRAEVRDFVRANLPDSLKAKGREGLELTKDDYVTWQKILRQKGWFGAAWPSGFGGSDWDLEQQLIFLQEAALNDAPMLIPYGVSMLGPVIQNFGSPEIQAEHLPGILNSDVWWCQGYSEPNAGSDLASLKTSAVRDGDHYVVNGSKMWTTEAQWADRMHCLVRTDVEAKPQKGISFLLIDMDSPGITVRPVITIDGQHHTNQVFLDNVRVPVANLVGQEGQGWTIAKFLLSHERVAIAETGAKLRLLERVRGLVEAAEGSPVRERLRLKLAEVEIQLLALCSLEATYVRRWNSGEPKEGPEASVLKIRGTEVLQRLTEVALEAEGPLAAVHNPADLHLMPGQPLSPYQQASAMAHQYLYGRCWSIFGGTNEIQRGIIARSLLF